MMYTKSDFGRALLFELKKGYDIVRLSRWAFSIFISHQRQLDECLNDDIMKIVAMEGGFEFELTESELRAFAENLLTSPCGFGDHEVAKMDKIGLGECLYGYFTKK